MRASSTSRLVGPASLLLGSVSAVNITVSREPAQHLPDGEAVRRVPVLAILHPDSSERVIVVGSADVLGQREVRIAVVEARRTGKEWTNFDDDDALTSLLTSWVERALQQVTVEHTGEISEEWASAAAKAIAEAARDGGGTMREIRYPLDRDLTAGLRGKGSTTSSLLANLIDLQLLASTAADAADNAVREGMYLWKTQSAAYHRYRSHRDASLLVAADLPPLGSWSWIRRHDAGIRQCEALSAAGREDVLAVTNLLSAATTLATTREAETQQTMTTLLSVAALALGVPALLLALYSADSLVPLRDVRQGIALLPVAISLVIAGFLATTSAGGTARMRKIVWGMVALLLVLLGVSGLMAP